MVRSTSIPITPPHQPLGLTPAASTTNTSTRSLLHQAKRDPVFSITYTRFAIHNFAYPQSFVTTAHVCRKTPGGGVSSISKISETLVTPIESVSFTKSHFSPFRICLFHNYRGVPRFLLSSFTSGFLWRPFLVDAYGSAKILRERI